MEEGIVARGVVKSFKNTTALRMVNLTAGRGINIIIGPNGAGKSTLLKCLGGLYLPEKGTVSVLGSDPYHDDDLRNSMSMVSDNYSLYDRLSVYDNMLFFGRLYGIADGEIKARTARILRKLDAYEYIDRRVSELSRGTKQKIAICRALISEPRVLLLDEPTAFLDASSAGKVHAILEEEARKGRIIVYATQRLNEAARFDASIFIIKRGVLDGKIETDNLYNYALKGSMVIIRLGNKLSDSVARKTPNFRSYSGYSLKIMIKDYKGISKSLSYLLGKGAYVISVDYSEPLLEKLMVD